MYIKYEIILFVKADVNVHCKVTTTYRGSHPHNTKIINIKDNPSAYFVRHNNKSE